MIENSPDLLGSMAAEHPARFARLVTEALTTGVSADRAGTAIDAASTLLSTASGIKNQASSREEFLARMTTGIGLLLLALDCMPCRRPAINTEIGGA